MELLLIIGTVIILCFLAAYRAGVRIKLPVSSPPESQPENIPYNKDQLTRELFSISDNLAPYLNQAANASDLLGHPEFVRGVEILERKPFQDSDLLQFYNGDNFLLGCMAVEALSRRPDNGNDLSEPLLRTMSTMAPWTRWFALRALSARGKPPLAGRVLAILDDSWENRHSYLILREFLQQRFADSETLNLAELLADKPKWQADGIARILQNVGTDITQGLLDDLEKKQESTLDIPFLSAIGKIWDQVRDEEIIAHDTLVRQAAEIRNLFNQDSRRSVLLVGPRGVGKSTLLRYASQQLQEEGWTIFEASADEIMAGQTYIGQLEERLKDLMRNLKGERRVLWVIPMFHELMWAGRHQQSPVSVLDRIVPALEKSEINVVGEINHEACDRLLRRYPRLKDAMDFLRIDSLPDEQALVLARNVAQKLEAGGAKPIPLEILPEALKLCEQYLGRDSSPGHILDLIKRTTEARGSVDGSGEPVSYRDLLITLSGLTGLPQVILDERESLDLWSLREFFEGRVLGQPEAVDCLVDRVAMIKAGLTDPTRPLGVFLFAGPTGTGKTELAKSLAEFLFGSTERMIRIDMSELQSENSLERILGAPGQDQESLADRIRNQPFAVVLLDEFEKAHRRVWDLFLQLFDDGRLTDRRGNTADFRHAIVIMTSNLGGHYGSHIGFGSQPDQTDIKTIEREFAREFLNRIDRIVVFRALNRSIMREILVKELEEALQRRGLRTRQWAVEWESSAIDFLLTKGFTDDLGARPLKRAIERHLLSPLATTIVDHQFPEGDQFLFVRSDGEKIEVAFVDPDEPDETLPEEHDADQVRDEPLRVRNVALAPHGDLEEMDLLNEHYTSLKEMVENDKWVERKRLFMESMTLPEFWSSEKRFSTLGEAEFMDRIEEGLRTVGSLLERLSGGSGGRRDRFSTSILKKVAQRIYLVEAACRGFEQNVPRDAFVLIEGQLSPQKHAEANAAFAGKVTEMYSQWARRRGMQWELLTETPGGTGQAHRAILAISGFAVYPILTLEQGIHDMEVPGPRERSVHYRVKVRVSPQPDEPVFGGPESELAQAEAILSSTETEKLPVVRRYREKPSPLVRDSIRKFRTGRIDVVWRGDFDLL